MKYSCNEISKGKHFASDKEALENGYKFVVTYQMLAGRDYFNNWGHAQARAKIHGGKIFDVETGNRLL